MQKILWSVVGITVLLGGYGLYTVAHKPIAALAVQTHVFNSDAVATNSPATITPVTQPPVQTRTVEVEVIKDNPAQATHIATLEAQVTALQAENADLKKANQVAKDGLVVLNKQHETDAIKVTNLCLNAIDSVKDKVSQATIDSVIDGIRATTWYKNYKAVALEVTCADSRMGSASDKACNELKNYTI